MAPHFTQNLPSETNPVIHAITAAESKKLDPFCKLFVSGPESAEMLIGSFGIHA